MINSTLSLGKTLINSQEIYSAHKYKLRQNSMYASISGSGILGNNHRNAQCSSAQGSQALNKARAGGFGSPQAGCWPHSRASVTRKWESRDDSGGKREAPHGPQDRAEVSVFSGRGRPSAWPHATVTSISATSQTSERRHRHYLGQQKSRYGDL